jgi:parvulin-like peptidyl-prolyl isomerase
MKRFAWILLASLWLAPAAAAQQVVDRVVARIGDNVITASQVAQLGSFQLLVDGKRQTPAERLHELAEQWIVKREAALSGFPPPTAPEVKSAYLALEKRFGSAGALEKRLKALGLSDSDARQLLAREMFLGRYLDYKFRPEVQVDERQIEEYYRETLVPELKKAGQSAPPIAAVAGEVRQVLVERGVSQLAGRWLDQMQAQWKVDTVQGLNSSSE